MSAHFPMTEMETRYFKYQKTISNSIDWNYFLSMEYFRSIEICSSLIYKISLNSTSRRKQMIVQVMTYQKILIIFQISRVSGVVLLNYSPIKLMRSNLANQLKYQTCVANTAFDTTRNALVFQKWMLMFSRSILSLIEK